MLLCLKKDKTPWTCCCGCTVTCGVIFYSVLQGLYLLSAILTFEVGPIITVLILQLPLICLIVKRKSLGARTCMVVWLWV